MVTSVNHRVQKEREELRASSLSPICISDTGRADFANECSRQSRTAAASDAVKPEFDAFANAALTGLDDDIA